MIKLDGKTPSFTASAGIDDEVKEHQSVVEFVLVGDNKKLWSSGIMH